MARTVLNARTMEEGDLTTLSRRRAHLHVSAFLWLHTPPQFSNAWMVGLLTATTAAVAFAVPRARYLNAALGVWLLASNWALPLFSDATARNNIAVSILLFIFSLSGAPATSEVDY